MNRNSITDIPGIRVGHAQDNEALTGCTVILCEAGAVAGVDQRGGAPGTRETDALRPLHLVDRAHAVLLTGGSAFGLDAATGVMRYLEERGVGFDTGVARVPIVPAAVLFDLAIGRADVRPDANMGYQACLAAATEAPLQGNFGAGAGATVGKIKGMTFATKSGIGTFTLNMNSGLIVGALVAVNAFGDVIDPMNGKIVAGLRQMADTKATGEFYESTIKVMKELSGGEKLDFTSAANTVIGVVATNASLTKEQANWVAQMAQDGIARAISPAHTLLDGDTLFCLSTGDVQADANIVGALAAEAVSEAILQAVMSAKPAGGLPSPTSFLEGNL